MRTVYLGTSEFAAGVLRRLAASPHRPSLVLTRPDRPRGRGRRLASPPVADAARELGIELAQPESVNEDAARAQISAAAPEVVCVCAFGALIKEPLLSEYEMLNVHPSLLPRWRGAAPIERAIIAGDDRTGVSIMRLTAGLDSGPVCAQATEPITPEDTYGTLSGRLEGRGGDLLVEALDRRPDCAPQDEALATYAEKLTPEDRLLDSSRPAAELERRVRALSPHIGAAVELPDGRRLGVWEARVLGEPAPPAPATAPTPAAPATAPTPAAPATAPTPAAPAGGEVSLGGERPVLGCAPGALELVTVQPPGKRPMSGEDFLRGLRG